MIRSGIISVSGLASFVMNQADEDPATSGGPEHGHVPVLLDEIMEILSPTRGDIAVDGTAGRGGHSVALAAAVGRSGQVISFDLDESNLAYAEARAREAGHSLTPIHSSFESMPEVLNERGLRADVVLLDLGFSSTQMDDGYRGFSFRSPGPLDMRYDRTTGLTAKDLVMELPERELADLIFRFGEDPFARRIARKLAQIRSRETMDTTEKLARAVRDAYGPNARRSRVDPATRTFMALRIAVNDELGCLNRWLESLRSEAMRIGNGEDGQWLRSGARVGVISFHSLEDRLVKRAFVELKAMGMATVLTKKPVVATDAERFENPRARSAKFRAARIGRAD